MLEKDFRKERSKEGRGRYGENEKKEMENIFTELQLEIMKRIKREINND